MLVRKVAPVLLPFAYILLASVNALAQSQLTGRLTGTVRDPSSAVIVRAEVTVSNNATAETRKALTDNEGSYIVPLLPPGTYRVRVTANGFSSALFDSVQVVITETTAVNAELAVAGIIVDPVMVRR